MAGIMRSSNWLLIFGLLVLAAQAQEVPPGCGEISTDRLVYTRSIRPDDQYANFAHWYDGGLPDRFTESDLVIDDLKGKVETIHNCTTSPTICAAHDGRVSPDGLRIAYTLAEGDSLYSVKTWGDNRLTPPIEFTAVRYSIWIYDTLSKTTQRIEQNARMPDWISDSEIVFASNRAGVYVPWAVGGATYAGKSLQIYRARVVE